MFFKQYITIKNSCLGYICSMESPRWQIGVEICVCYDEQLVKEVEENMFGEKYER